jgi:hypothetical protein
VSLRGGGLWTRQIVRDLITQRLEVHLSLASIGADAGPPGTDPTEALAACAYQRDPAAIARWQRTTYPAIVRRAKREKAEIYFWDESGLRADAVQGRTGGPRTRPRCCRSPGSVKTSAPPRRSRPRGPSGSPPIRRTDGRRIRNLAAPVAAGPAQAAASDPGWITGTQDKRRVT